MSSETFAQKFPDISKLPVDHPVWVDVGITDEFTDAEASSQNEEEQEMGEKNKR